MSTIWLPQSVAQRIKRHEYLKSVDIEQLKDNPVCPRCERVALRDEGWSTDKTAQCPHCGYKGRMTVTLKEYAAKELYR